MRLLSFTLLPLAILATQESFLDDPVASLDHNDEANDNDSNEHNGHSLNSLKGDVMGYLRAIERVLLNNVSNRHHYLGDAYAEMMYDRILMYAEQGILNEMIKNVDQKHEIFTKAVEFGLIEAPRTINIDYNCDDNQCDVPLDLRGVWNYGCYCNFGSELTTGKGAAVNTEDAICKRMQLCLRCAERDAKEGGYKCDTRTVTYNSTLGQSNNGQNINPNSFNSGCQVQNPNDLCAAHVCTCEMQLINEFLQVFWSGKMHDPAPRHPDNPYGGTFDYEANCYSAPGVTEMDCCGKYPFRWTFNSMKKECCDAVEEIYQPLGQVCCADGVKSIGEGC